MKRSIKLKDTEAEKYPDLDLRIFKLASLKLVKGKGTMFRGRFPSIYVPGKLILGQMF
jgi:hypothetical protein